MALPVSTIAPMPAPRLIDPGSYSPFVEVNIPGLSAELRNLVCGTVFNTLALKATTNQLRTFTYNLIAKGEYRSTDFIELCEFAGNYAVLCYLKDKQRRQHEISDRDKELSNITVAIQQKVPEAITLWMSSLLYRYKDLEFEIGSSLAHKTKQLSNSYINFTKEIKNMSLDQNTIMALAQLLGNQGQNNAMNQVIGAVGQQNDPIVNFVVNGQSMQMRQSQALALKAAMQQGQMAGNGNSNSVLAALGLLGNQQGMQQAGVGGFNPQQLMAALNQRNNERPALGGFTTDANGQFAQPQGHYTGGGNRLADQWRRERGMVADEVQIGAPQKSPDAIVELNASENSMNIPSVNASEVNVAVPQQDNALTPPAAATSTVTTAAEKPAITKEMKIQGGSEKAFRNEDIHVMGIPIFKQDTPSYTELKRAITTLLKSSPEKSTMRVVEKNLDGEEIESYQDNYVVINSSPIFSNSNMSLVEEVRECHIKQLHQSDKVSQDIYAGYGYCVKPIYHQTEGSKAVLEGIFKRMTGIHKLRSYLEATAAGLKDMRNSTGMYFENVELRDITSALNSLDRWLAGMTNDFMRNELNNATTIDSFVSDYKDLEVFLAKSLGDEAVAALDRHMEDALCSLREGGTEAVREYLASLSDDVGIAASGIVETCLVVSLPFTESELGLYTKVQNRYVDPKANSTIYDLIKAMFVTEESLEFVALNRYIATMDGIVCAIHRSPFQDDGFIIHRVNDR